MICADDVRSRDNNLQRYKREWSGAEQKGRNGLMLARTITLGTAADSCYAARSAECVTSWLPRYQWELCAHSLLAQGLLDLDARTVPLQLQVSGTVMARTLCGCQQYALQPAVRALLETTLS